jgi:hypothetical protein
MVAIIYDTATRQVLAINPERRLDGTLILPTGISVGAVDIAPSEAAKFSRPGSFTLDPDGQTIVITPPGPPDPGETERLAARADLRANVQAAQARLQAIATNGSAYTPAQVRDAVVDIARLDLRVIRLLAEFFT